MLNLHKKVEIIFYDEVVDTYKKYGIPEQTIGGMEHPVANELLKKANKNGLEMTIVPFFYLLKIICKNKYKKSQ